MDMEEYHEHLQREDENQMLGDELDDQCPQGDSVCDTMPQDVLCSDLSEETESDVDDDIDEEDHELTDGGCFGEEIGYYTAGEQPAKQLGQPTSIQYRRRTKATGTVCAGHNGGLPNFKTGEYDKKY